MHPDAKKECSKVTAKDYEIIAELFRTHTVETLTELGTPWNVTAEDYRMGARAMRSGLVSAFVAAAKKDNPRFDEAAFRAAMNGERRIVKRPEMVHEDVARKVLSRKAAPSDAPLALLFPRRGETITNIPVCEDCLNDTTLSDKVNALVDLRYEIKNPEHPTGRVVCGICYEKRFLRRYHAPGKQVEEDLVVHQYLIKPDSPRVWKNVCTPCSDGMGGVEFRYPGVKAEGNPRGKGKPAECSECHKIGVMYGVIYGLPKPTKARKLCPSCTKESGGGWPTPTNCEDCAKLNAE